MDKRTQNDTGYVAMLDDDYFIKIIVSGYIRCHRKMLAYVLKIIKQAIEAQINSLFPYQEHEPNFDQAGFLALLFNI